MKSFHINVAYAGLATTMEIRSTQAELARQGADWITLPLLEQLWAVSTVAPQHADLRSFPGSVGVFVEPDTGHLACFKVQRRSDTSGRSYLWREYWIVSSQEATLLSLSFGALRQVWGSETPGDGKPRVASQSIEVSSGSERLVELVSQSRPTGWLDLWLALVGALGDRQTPVAVQDCQTDQQVDLAEAVLLSLPLAWRRRFSFATGVHDALGNAATIRFLSAPSTQGAVNLFRAGEVTVPKGDPAQSYVHLIRSALDEGWLRDLADSLLKIKTADSTKDLTRQLHAIRHGFGHITPLLLRQGSAKEIAAELGSLGWGRIDLNAICPPGFWERLTSADDLLTALPNFVELRKRIAQRDQDDLDTSLILVARRTLPGRSDAGEAIRQAERLINVEYPWSARGLADALSGLLALAFTPPDSTALIRLASAIVRAYPACLDELLRSPGLDFLAEAALVLSAPQRLPSSPLSAHSWLIETPARQWIIRRWPSSTSTSLALPLALETTNGRWYALKALSKTDVVGIRPYVKGQNLERQARMLGDSDLRLALEHTARALDSLHRQGAYHGNLKPQNVILSPSGACLVDESPDAFGRPTIPKDNIVRDKQALAGLTLWAIEQREEIPGLSANAREKIISRAAEATSAEHALSQVWEGVHTLMEREQARKYLLELLRSQDPDIRQALQQAQPAASSPGPISGSAWGEAYSNGQSQLAQVRAVESRLNKLEARLDTFPRESGMTPGRSQASPSASGERSSLGLAVILAVLASIITNLLFFGLVDRSRRTPEPTTTYVTTPAKTPSGQIVPTTGATHKPTIEATSTATPATSPTLTISPVLTPTATIQSASTRSSPLRSTETPSPPSRPTAALPGPTP